MLGLLIEDSVHLILLLSSTCLHLHTDVVHKIHNLISKKDKQIRGVEEYIKVSNDRKKKEATKMRLNKVMERYLK